MPDRILAGEVPPTTSAYFKDYAPGTVWFAVWERAADASHKTIGFTVVCTNQATYIRASLAGPEQDGGPIVQEIKPTGWSTPPATDPGGWQVPGRSTFADMVLAKANFYRFEVLCSGVRVHYDVQVGPLDVSQTGRYIDLDEAWKHTPQGRLAEERAKILDMARPKGNLGRPRGSRVSMPRRVP